MAKKNTVAIVVTYNRIDLLVECINALLKTDCDILIIDNASTDGTKEKVQEQFGEKVIYINTKKNLGGAGGFNFGIKEAYNLGYDYFWIMDDDCIVTQDSLKELQNAAREIKQFGFLASKVLWKDGSLSKMNIPRKSFTKTIDANCSEILQISMASFVSLFIPRETVKQNGLPISDFFIWGDDIEYTKRISKNNKCYFIPKSIVIHKSNNNAGSDISKDSTDRLQRYYYAYRNETYIFRKEGIKGRLLHIAKIIKHVAKVLSSNANSKKERLAIIKKGIISGKTFDPEVENV